jgi:hypothetical protein
VPFSSELTVEFYVNGVLHKSYYFEGDNPPVVTVNPAFEATPHDSSQIEDLPPVPVNPADAPNNPAFAPNNL